MQLRELEWLVQRYTKRWTCFANQQEGRARQKFLATLGPPRVVLLTLTISRLVAKSINLKDGQDGRDQGSRRDNVMAWRKLVSRFTSFKENCGSNSHNLSNLPRNSSQLSTGLLELDRLPPKMPTCFDWQIAHYIVTVWASAYYSRVV